MKAIKILHPLRSCSYTGTIGLGIGTSQRCNDYFELCHSAVKSSYLLVAVIFLAAKSVNLPKLIEVLLEARKRGPILSVMEHSK
jgi:hypothetical protein